MQNPRYTISASLAADAAEALERSANVMHLSRSKLLTLCVRKGLPLVIAESVAALTVELPAVELPTADLPRA